VFVIKPKQKKAIWMQAFPEQVEVKQIKEKKVKVRNPIKYRTKKRASQESIYRARVKVWLTEPENLTCRVYPYLQATQCHHTHGRRGKCLLYEPWWLPVSDLGHRHIETNIEEARIKGWLCKKGLYNTPPKEP
jgi:hypothetical protein